VHALDVTLSEAVLPFTSVQLTDALLVVATPRAAVLEHVNGPLTPPGGIFERSGGLAPQSPSVSVTVQDSVVGPLFVTVML